MAFVVGAITDKLRVRSPIYFPQHGCLTDSMAAAESIIEFASWYGILGLGVAILFLAIGLNRIDGAAHGTYLFRVLLVPGIVLIWPLVLILWARRELQRVN